MPLPGQKNEADWQLLSLEAWAGLNTKALRPAIEDGEFSHIENFMPLGKRNLRTLYGEGSVLYQAPTGLTIIYRYDFILSGTDYWAVFLSDGSAVQVNATTGATTTIGAAGTFYSSASSLPACAQFQNKYLAIVSTLTVNSYWIWDGTNLYTAGSLGPDTTVTNAGKNYTSTPTVTIAGGSGSGATATAVIKNQTVTQLNITNPGSGYQLDDLPVATISGGGTDSGASGTAVIDTASGAVTTVNVLNGGTGYTTSTVLTFAGGGGTGAVAVVTGLTNGTITAITVTAGGYGYTYPPIITASVGSGAQFLAEISAGGIIGVTMTSGGSGYVQAPTVTITGDGTGATAIANMTSSSSVVSVNITNGGSGYTTSPTVSFSGSSAAAATGVAIVQGGVVTYVVITNPGDGYLSAPSVSFSGGGGSGAAATTTLAGAGGKVQSIVITNQGSGYTHAAVTFSGGNNSASVTIDIFPFGFSGTTIETYQNRVWIANGINIYGTAANTTGTFAASAGGIIFQSVDATLRQKVTRLAQSSGSLYVFGDSSISSFSNVTVNSNGSANYNFTNIDPQVGTPWPNSVAAFGRALVFANATGVYALFGGAAEKVSANLDGLFENASFNTGGSGVTPTGAAAVLFETKCYVFCFTTYVPYSQATRTLQAIWDGQRWFLGSQSHATQFVATREVNSGLTAWGDDGTNLYPMFTAPSDTLTKAFQTKLFGVQPTYVQSTRVYVLAQVTETTQSTPNLSIAVDTELGLGTLVPNQQLAAANPNLPSLYGYSAANYGRLMGLTCTTTVGDVTIMNESLLAREYAPYG